MPRLLYYIPRFNRIWMGKHEIHTLSTAISYCAKGSLANKNKSFGEDAAVTSTWTTPGTFQGASLMAVADGVGGWKRHGVDPSFLSQGLVKEMAERFQKFEEHPEKQVAEEEEQEEEATDSGPAELPSCQQLLTSTFTKMYDIGSQFAGGTTVCMAKFNPQSAQVEVLNLGDSGAILIRNNEIVEKTVPDVDGMTPRQLTILPSWMGLMEDGPDLNPEVQAKVNSINTWQLEPRDILILATDGYFDNVSLQETISILNETQAEKENKNGEHSSPESVSGPIKPQELADNLLMRAYYNSLNPLITSPFALRLLQESDGADDYWGGKPDDITVIVCIAEESDLDFSSRL